MDTRNDNMDIRAKDKYLRIWEILIVVYCVLSEIACFIYAMHCFSESYTTQGLIHLLVVPFLILLSYVFLMVLVSFFYDVKEIRDRVKKMDERNQIAQINSSSNDMESSSQSGIEKEKDDIEDLDIDELIHQFTKKK